MKRMKNGFKMICEDCKKEIKKLPIKEAVKSRKWWKKEFKEFGWGNLLIIIAILILFSGFYFEFGPKVKNPCDWCEIRIERNNEIQKIKCIDWYKEIYEVNSNKIDIEVDNGNFEDIFIK